jgi:hypothetical protein
MSFKCKQRTHAGENVKVNLLPTNWHFKFVYREAFYTRKVFTTKFYVRACLTKAKELAEECTMRSFIKYYIDETRKLKWVEHVAGVGRMINAYKFLVGKSGNSEYKSVHSRIILEWISGKEGGKVRNGSCV